MELNLKLIIILSSSPVIILVFHAIASRLSSLLALGLSSQLVCIMSALIVNFIMAGLIYCLVLRGDNADILNITVYSFLVYNSIAYSYFHIFNMSETARRIRVLNELSRVDGIKREEIIKFYEVNDMFQVRIDRLISLGQIEQRGEIYKLKGRLLLVAAKILDFWCSIVGHSMLDDANGD